MTTKAEDMASMDATVRAFNGDDPAPDRPENFEVFAEPGTPEHTVAAAKVREVAIDAITKALAEGKAWTLSVLDSYTDVGPDAVNADTFEVGMASFKERAIMATNILEQVRRTLAQEAVAQLLAGTVDVGGEGSDPDHGQLQAEDDGMQAAIGAAHIQQH